MKPRDLPAAWVSDFTSERPSPEAVARMQRAFRTWLKSGRVELLSASGRRARRPSLARCAGLPESPERVRLMVRDVHLRRAARLVVGASVGAWGRATALHEAAREFMGTKWPCWCDMEAPPMHATALQRELWEAAIAAGGKLPETARRVAQILSD